MNLTEQEAKEQWGKEAKEQTLDTLPDFISKVIDEGGGDYGKICVAMGTAAAATAWSINNTPKGGITGFQAGAVFWEFVRAWGSPTLGKSGTSIINWDNALYPQYEDSFQKTISRGTLTKLKEMAEENLKEVDGYTAPRVIDHWKMLASGGVPFGLSVRD